MVIDHRWMPFKEMMVWCRLLRNGYVCAGTSHLTKGQRLTVSVIIIVYYATKAANIHTQLHVQEHNKNIKKTLKITDMQRH